MADRSVRALLDRAADAAGDRSALPSVESFRQRRRARRRTGFTVVASVSAVLVVAAVAAVLTADRSAKSDQQHTAPAVTQGRVTVQLLRHYRWTALPPAPIGSRSDSVSVWTGSQMIVWGGSADGRAHTDGAAYTPGTRTWAAVPAAPLEPRSRPDAVWTGSRLIIWGGERGATQLTDGAMYDPIARTWAAMAPAPPLHGNGEITLLAAGDLAIRLSLDKPFAATRVQADAFDPTSNTWTALPSIRLSPVGNYTGVTGAVIDGRFVAWVSSAGSFVLGDHDRGWSRINYSPGAGCIYTVISAGQRIIYPASFDAHACGGDLAFTPGTRGTAVEVRTGHATTIPYTSTSDAGTVAVWTGGALLNADTNALHAFGLHVRAGTTAAWNPGAKAWVELATAPAVDRSATWQWTGTELIGYGHFGAGTDGISFSR